MTTVTSTTPATTTSTSAGSLGSTSAAEQQDRFMKLLVAQMKNQDPLNPMDNAQMTSQIAQINTVSGIEKLNDTVASLLAAFGSLQAQNASQLAGQDVLVPGTGLALQDGAATGGVSLSAAADTVNVDVIDATGRTVRTIALGANAAGARSFRWDGQLSDGSSAPDGSYRFRVTASKAGAAVQAQALTAARVLSVVPGADGTVQLDLGAAGLQPQSAVRAYL